MALGSRSVIVTGFLLAPATCPGCGSESEGVFLRDFALDDLVCQSCRNRAGVDASFPQDETFTQSASVPVAASSPTRIY